MADEQSPQSDLIDDAIRNAEQQLEAKLRALRLSALGTDAEAEPTSGEPTFVDHDDLAARTGTGAPVEPDDTAVEAPVDGGDAVLRPTGRSSSAAPSDEWMTHEGDAPWSIDVPARSGAAAPTDSWQSPSSAATDTGAHGVTLAPQEPIVAAPAPSRLASHAAPVGAAHGPTAEEFEFWAQTRTALRAIQQGAEAMPRDVASTVVRDVERVVREELVGPSAALRQVQQHVQHGLPKLADRIETAVRDEVDAAGAPVRQLHEELPAHVDRIVREVSTHVDDAFETQSVDLRAGVRADSREDLGRLERIVASNVTKLTTSLGEQVGRVESKVGGMSSASGDVAQLVEAVRAQVARLDAGLLAVDERAGRIEHVSSDVHHAIGTIGATVGELGVQLDDAVSRIAATDVSARAAERAVGSLDARFDELDVQIRAELGRVDASMRNALDASATSATRSEQAIIEQVRASERDVSGVLVSILDANKLALERFSQVARDVDAEQAARRADIEADRTTRAEDLELLVDTMAAGWESMTTAMSRLFEQNTDAASRLERIEERFTQLRDIEAHVESTMREVKQHVEELQPAPVVVTVNHPEATVSNATKGGYTSGSAR